MAGRIPNVGHEVRQAFLLSLRRGEIRPGVVTAIENFGVFVDIGGADGMVNCAELSWKHYSHPGEIVEVGERIDVEVLDVDMDRERIALSLKSLQEDPWRGFAQMHRPRQQLAGFVTKIVPFGVFVRLADGIEGLVHSPQGEKPRQVAHVGDQVTVEIVDVDLEHRRVSLSLVETFTSCGEPD